MAGESLAARLKAFREARGLTKYRLAKLSTEYSKKYGGRGISQTYIYRLEKGEIKNPRRDTLQALAIPLNVTVAELIGETKPHEIWSLVEQSLKAYIPVYSGLYEVGMTPIDHVVSNRVTIPPETVRGYKIEGLALAPEVEEGDILIVDTALDPKPGDIVMLTSEEPYMGAWQLFVKRYNETVEDGKYVEDNDRRCILNERGCCEADGVCVYGVVTELVRKLR